MEHAGAGPQRFSRRLYLLSAMSFLVFAGAGAQQAYLVPYLGRVTDFSDVQCASVLAAVYFSMLVFRIVNVYVFAGWSDRRMTIVGALTYLLFTVVMYTMALFQSYAFALTAAVLWGVGASMMWCGTAMQTLTISDAAGGRHGTGMGILYSSTHAGWAAGAVVLGLVYQNLTVETSALMCAVAAAITLGGNIISFFIPATGRVHRERPRLAGLWAMIVAPKAAISGMLQFASALGYGLVLGVFSSYVEDRFGPQWITRSIWMYPAIRMLLSFWGGYLADRIGRTPVLVAGFAVGALGLVVTLMWVSPVAVLLTVGALALLGSTVPVVAAAMVGDAADIQRRPIAYGIVFAWRDLGVAVAAIGASILGVTFDFNVVLQVFIIIFAACGMLSVYLGRFAAQKL